MPLALFRELVLKCVNTGEDIFKATLINPVSKIMSIPLELKILAVVRLLATGIKFCEAAELSGYMSETYFAAFFKEFNRVFVQHFKEASIKPLCGSELLAQLARSAKLGLPGMIASMDATFIACDKIPKVMQNLCNGTKGKGYLYQAGTLYFFIFLLAKILHIVTY